MHPLLVSWCMALLGAVLSLDSSTGQVTRWLSRLQCTPEGHFEKQKLSSSSDHLSTAPAEWG